MKPRLLIALGLSLLCLASCLAPKPVVVPPPCSIQELQARYITNTYEHFVASYEYPVTMKIYRNPALIAQVTAASPIYICLDQQRGRLYVGGKVAMDWPVSTGVASRLTPTGAFKIIEKKETYASNLYGKMLDAEGKCINGDAKSTDEVPEGGEFVPSSMPYWQRLTNDGIGMHIGNVRAGRRLSHGCIRTPRPAAKELYSLTSNGKTRVYVVQALENPYYVKNILVQKTGLPKWTPRVNNGASVQTKADDKANN